LPPELIHRETFRVCFFHSEPGGRASVPSLCRFAQETADAHCRTFDMSLLHLRSQNRMWVLTRFRLRMHRYPVCGEPVTVETWASDRTNGIRAVRDFQFLSADGEVIGHALSLWLMLDVTKRRPVRLPQVVLDIRNPERSIPGDFEFPRLKAPEQTAYHRQFQVGWRDLDANNHANNVNYIEWALDVLPLGVCRDYMLTQLDVEFLSEALYGQEITSAAGKEPEATTFCHHIGNGQATLAVLRTQWDHATKDIA
jgi:acyl-ACP thioesterase